jgi:hypothetical protein
MSLRRSLSALSVLGGPLRRCVSFFRPARPFERLPAAAPVTFEAGASPWPDGCEGAVSLTFDDGMASHLQLGVPTMNDLGVRGTFYVNARVHNWQRRLALWRPVALAGHEVGNHTVDHICSRNFDFISGKNLEDLTLEEMEWQIAEGKRRLVELIPEQAEMTFCYPCYQAHVGEGPTRQSYVPLVARHHPAGRGRGEVANDPARVDLHYLSAWSVERMSGPEMVGYAERAATQGRWTILAFHGIEEGSLSVSKADFTELLAHLARHRNRLWVAPVVEVATRVRHWRAARALEAKPKHLGPC